MTAFIVVICIILFLILIFQIARVIEALKTIKGEKAAFLSSNNSQALGLLIFGTLFLILTIGSMFYFKRQMLGYEPLISASIHGVWIEKLFNVTLISTGIVFIITHIFLFWFGFKYRYAPGRKALFMPHDNKLEIIWTAAPSVVMAYLVITGLVAWNKVMADVKPNDKAIEIEATGMQFAWILRYPGIDQKLGTSNFKLIDSENDLGQDWDDPKNLDDFKPDEIVLPVGEKVRVRIKSRDVLHSFYLPHFKVKMDAVPGLPTYFVFTPSITTADYKANLSKYSEWQVPADPADPNGKRRWEAFNFELACAELCGTSHFAMKRVVRIVTKSEYVAWLKTQKSFYESNIKKTSKNDSTQVSSPVKSDSLKLTK